MVVIINLKSMFYPWVHFLICFQLLYYQQFQQLHIVLFNILKMCNFIEKSYIALFKEFKKHYGAAAAAVDNRVVGNKSENALRDTCSSSSSSL